MEHPYRDRQQAEGFPRDRKERQAIGFEGEVSLSTELLGKQQEEIHAISNSLLQGAEDLLAGRIYKGRVNSGSESGSDVHDIDEDDIEDEEDPSSEEIVERSSSLKPVRLHMQGLPKWMTKPSQKSIVEGPPDSEEEKAADENSNAEDSEDEDGSIAEGSSGSVDSFFRFDPFDIQELAQEMNDEKKSMAVLHGKNEINKILSRLRISDRVEVIGELDKWFQGQVHNSEKELILLNSQEEQLRATLQSEIEGLRGLKDSLEQKELGNLMRMDGFYNRIAQAKEKKDSQLTQEPELPDSDLMTNAILATAAERSQKRVSELEAKMEAMKMNIRLDENDLRKGKVENHKTFATDIIRVISMQQDELQIMYGKLAFAEQRLASIGEAEELASSSKSKFGKQRRGRLESSLAPPGREDPAHLLLDQVRAEILRTTFVEELKKDDDVLELAWLAAGMESVAAAADENAPLDKKQQKKRDRMNRGTSGMINLNSLLEDEDDEERKEERFSGKTEYTVEMFKELEAESQFLQVEIEFLQGQISQEAYEKAKENKGLNKQVKEEGDRRQRAMAAAEAQQGRRRSTESQAKNAREQVPDDDHLDFKKLLGAAKGAVGALRENREKLAMVVGRQINRKLDKRGIIESSYEAPLQGPAGDNRKPTRGSRGVGTKGKRRSSRQRAREKKTRAHEKVLQNKELAKAQGKLEDLKEESLDMHFEVNSIKERMRRLQEDPEAAAKEESVPGFVRGSKVRRTPKVQAALDEDLVEEQLRLEHGQTQAWEGEMEEGAKARRLTDPRLTEDERTQLAARVTTKATVFLQSDQSKSLVYVEAENKNLQDELEELLALKKNHDASKGRRGCKLQPSSGTEGRRGSKLQPSSGTEGSSKGSSKDRRHRSSKEKVSSQPIDGLAGEEGDLPSSFAIPSPSASSSSEGEEDEEEQQQPTQDDIRDTLMKRIKEAGDVVGKDGQHDEDDTSESSSDSEEGEDVEGSGETKGRRDGTTNSDEGEGGEEQGNKEEEGSHDDELLKAGSAPKKRKESDKKGGGSSKRQLHEAIERRVSGGDEEVPLGGRRRAETAETEGEGSYKEGEEEPETAGEGSKSEDVQFRNVSKTSCSSRGTNELKVPKPAFKKHVDPKVQKILARRGAVGDMRQAMNLPMGKAKAKPKAKPKGLKSGFKKEDLTSEQAELLEEFRESMLSLQSLGVDQTKLLKEVAVLEEQIKMARTMDGMQIVQMLLKAKQSSVVKQKDPHAVIRKEVNARQAEVNRLRAAWQVSQNLAKGKHHTEEEAAPAIQSVFSNVLSSLKMMETKLTQELSTKGKADEEAQGAGDAAAGAVKVTNRLRWLKGATGSKSMIAAPDVQATVRVHEDRGQGEVRSVSSKAQEHSSETEKERGKPSGSQQEGVSAAGAPAPSRSFFAKAPALAAGVRRHSIAVPGSGKEAGMSMKSLLRADMRSGRNTSTVQTGARRTSEPGSIVSSGGRSISDLSPFIPSPRKRKGSILKLLKEADEIQVEDSQVAVGLSQQVPSSPGSSDGFSKATSRSEVQELAPEAIAEGEEEETAETKESGQALTEEAQVAVLPDPKDDKGTMEEDLDEAQDKDKQRHDENQRGEE